MSRYENPSHRIYMTFFIRDGWQVQFLEQDCKTPLPRRFVFRDPDKIREMARKGQAIGTREDHQMLEAALLVGRGGLFLNLTAEQYRVLAEVKKPVASVKPAPPAKRAWQGQRRSSRY